MKIIKLLALILFFPVLSNAQDLPEYDSIKIYTDRNLYISGEPINFTAFEIPKNGNSLLNLSKVVYIELINPDGLRLNSGKFSLSMQKGSSGSLVIPTETVSGLYYLKTYTKYMRNAGPAFYSYTPIKIINPKKTDLFVSNKESGERISNTGNLFDQTIVSSIEVTLNGQKFNRRDSVLINIKPIKKAAKVSQNLCITVTREGTIDTSCLIYKPTLQLAHSNQYFLPETRGLTLSGRVKSGSTGKGIPFDNVHLSITGETKDYISVLTDSAGNYHFPLPSLEWKRDIFIFAEDKAGEDAVIFVDNDYCPEKVTMPFTPFTLKDQEQKAALELAINQQLEKGFPLEPLKIHNKRKADSIPFYGTPNKQIILDKYIQLPSIEEYINEFLPEVHIKKHNNKKGFIINGSQSELTVYPPLVLIDWIAVPDVEKILAMIPEKIARIEIINIPYVKGDMIFGGIISFISKREDFAGIDLASSGLFIRYPFFSSPEQKKVLTRSKNFPDARNTIFWEPCLPVDLNKGTEFWVQTGDSPGNYTVVIRGVNQSGKEYLGKASFIVSE